MTREPRNLHGRDLVFRMVFISFLWGTNVVFIKIGASALTPLYMASLRFFIASGTLFFYLRYKRLNPFSLSTRQDYRTYLINSFLFALQIGLFYLGIFRTSASHAAVLVNTHIFFVALLAHFMLVHDRLTPLKIAGLGIAFLGVITLFTDPANKEAGLSSWEGDLLILSSAIVLAIKTIFIKKTIETLNPVIVVFWEMGLGALFILLGGFFLGESFPQFFPASLVISLLYQGLVSGAFCFVATTALLKYYKASHIAAFLALVPFSGVLFSHLYLGERLTSSFILGGVLIIIGLAFATTTKPLADILE